MTENQTSQNRTPAGVPTGGQFAASAKGESGVALADAPANPAKPRGWTVFSRPQGASFNPWVGQIDMTDLTRAPEGVADDEAEDFVEEHVEEVAQKIAERLRTFPPADDQDERYSTEFEDIIEEFECADDVETFDWAMGSLYDWGDRERFIMKVLNP